MNQKCKRCNKEFPATTEYFNARSDTKSGFTGNCRKCIADKKRWYDRKAREKKKAEEATKIISDNIPWPISRI